MNDDIYFPVEKVPVSEIQNGTFDHPSGISHAIVVTKPDGVKRVVQYCSELYHLVPNDQIMPQFEAEISKHYNIEKSIRMNRWSQFFVDFVIKEKGITVGTKEDLIFPKITLINSYDGSIKYNFMAGFFRLLCSNGMMIKEGDVKQIKAMHTPSIGKETSFSAIMEMASEFLSVVEDMTEPYQELQEQPVKDWMMRIEEVVEETGFPLTLKEDVIHRMGIELDSLKGLVPTDWIVYNAFNYQLNHNTGIKAKAHKKDAMDQQVLEYLLKY